MKEYDKKICRPDSPQDGPKDGVMLKTECIRTDFVDEGKDEEPVIQQREKGEASITASIELGVFSIRDRSTDTMLSVAFQDAMEVIAAALDASKEAKECTEKTSESADTVESASDS